MTSVIIRALVPLLASLAVAGCASSTGPSTATTPPTAPTGTTTTATPAQCHVRGVLPDPACTPGETNPSVTQANISQTICVPGFTRGIRPPVSYTSPLKRSQITQYGYADTNPAHYEEDHLISLELGGAPSDPRNLWPEPGASPNPKDKVENALHDRICSGAITLADAQQRIATDWTTALR